MSKKKIPDWLKPRKKPQPLNREHVIKINGVEVTRAEFNKMPCMSAEAEAGHVSANDHWRKHRSQALRVPTAQVAEHREIIKRAGITGVDVHANGGVQFSSSGNRDKYMAFRQVGDYNSAGSGSMKGTGGST